MRDITHSKSAAIKELDFYGKLYAIVDEANSEITLFCTLEERVEYPRGPDSYCQPVLSEEDLDEYYELAAHGYEIFLA